MNTPPTWEEILQKSRDNFFVQALSKRYISMAVLDLSSHIATVVESKYDLELVGCSLPWNQLLARFAEHRINPEDKEMVLSSLSIENLLLLCDDTAHEKCIEARCQQTLPDTYEWVEILASIIDRDARQLLITTRSISETLLHKRVLDKFLYHQNCDFFILVDLKSNTYKTFNVSAGLLPIPEMYGIDYIADMLRFNRKYLAPNDMEKVIALMMPEQMLTLLAEQNEYSFSCGVITDAGEYCRARIQLISFDRTKSQIVITRSDITALYQEDKQRNDQLFHALHAAQRDLLTDLYNHSTTVEIVTQLLESHQGEQAAVLFIDIDNFKLVNDTLGHLQGNILLQKMAGFLRSILKNEWLVGRIGGDEFLLFIPNASSMEEVHQTGKAICGAFHDFAEMLQGLPVSCSVGISLYPQDGLVYEELVQKADKALYYSKKYGKNMYSLYSEESTHANYVSALSIIK